LSWPECSQSLTTVIFYLLFRLQLSVYSFECRIQHSLTRRVKDVYEITAHNIVYHINSTLFT